MKRLTTGLCVAATLAACGPAHVRLKPAPDVTASEQVRIRAYNKLRPKASRHTLMVQVDQYNRVATASTSLDHILLGDGTRIVYPEDLLPVVPPNSATALAAVSSAENRKIATPLYFGGLAGAFAGSMVMLAGFLSGPDDFDDPDFGKPNEALVGVGIGLAVVGLITWTVGLFLGASSANDRAIAFETYDDSLRQQLGICPEGSTGEDCD